MNGFWRICTLALALWAVLGVSLPARAQPLPGTMEQADQLMDAWQMPEAARLLEQLQARHEGSPEMDYLRARHAFYSGRYEQALAQLDQALTNVPRGSARHRDWSELRDIVANTLAVTRNYERHKSPDGRFEIALEPGKDRALLPYAFEALARAYDALAEELGHRPPTPIRVEVYPETSVLAKVSVLTEAEIRTSGTIALCKYNRLMITSPRALLRGYGWVDTLVHEYVHYVINQKSANRVPIWMHEGMAKFLERRWRGEGHEKLPPSSEQLLKQRLESGKLIPFEAMHPSMAKLPSQEDAAVAFAEVYTAMEYLRQKAGPGAFRRVLEGINAGKQAPDAFAEVLRTSFAQFEREWRVYLKSRDPGPLPTEMEFAERLYFKGDPKGGELDQIKQPRAREHVHLGEILQARKRYQAAVVQYQKAIHLMGNQNPILQTRLAQSLIALGRPREALDALVPLSAQYPAYVSTWLELGRASLALGEHAKAREYLTEAARINPFHPEIHPQLAQALEALGLSSEAGEARKIAQLIAP